MNQFSLKYYPPRIFIFILLVFLALYAGIKNFTHQHNISEVLNDSGIIIGASSIMALIFFLLNKFGMKMGLHHLLGLPDLRGNYEGELISSYHVNDDPKNPLETMKIQITITQNLNGCYISGKITPFVWQNHSSEFESGWTDIVPGNGEDFQLLYYYHNTPNMKFSEFDPVALNKHQGFCNLKFNTTQKTLKGYYFNYERNSNGQINLHFTQ